MTPDDLYKTILRTVTRVRDTRASMITGLLVEQLSATDAVLDEMARNAAQALIGLLDNPLQEPDGAERKLAEVTAQVIVKVAEIGLSDPPDKLGITPQALRLLARSHVELRDQIRALHDLVDLTDPNDPVGIALTKVGLERRPSEASRGPRLVPTPVQVEGMDSAQLVARYHRVMGNAIDFTKHATFVVRLWDGMDGCWTDCTGDVGRDEALRVWAKKTNGGVHHVSYGEIDYYAIFPSDTRMLWDGSEGMEMHR